MSFHRKVRRSNSDRFWKYIHFEITNSDFDHKIAQIRINEDSLWEENLIFLVWLYIRHHFCQYFNQDDSKSKQKHRDSEIRVRYIEKILTRHHSQTHQKRLVFSNKYLARRITLRNNDIKIRVVKQRRFLIITYYDWYFINKTFYFFVHLRSNRAILMNTLSLLIQFEWERARKLKFVILHFEESRKHSCREFRDKRVEDNFQIIEHVINFIRDINNLKDESQSEVINKKKQVSFICSRIATFKILSFFLRLFFCLRMNWDEDIVVINWSQVEKKTWIKQENVQNGSKRRYEVSKFVMKREEKKKRRLKMR